jgi:hypothetical protein
LEKEGNPTWAHFKLLLFVIFLAELLLLLMALIFGRLIGFRTTLTFCFWFGIILAGCFGLIVFGNLMVIMSQKIFIRRGRK